MWSTFARRLPFSQGLILVVCAILKFGYGRSWGQVGIILLFMELAAVAGAWWWHRLAVRTRMSNGEARMTEQ